MFKKNNYINSCAPSKSQYKDSKLYKLRSIFNMHLPNLFLISCFVTFTAAIFHKTGNEIGDRDVKVSDKTSEELTIIFSSSIIFWDLDKSILIPIVTKAEMKQDIMKDLVHMSEDSKLCICPRILGTLVCDSTGKLHASICNFHCRFADKDKDAVTPIMIMTETPFQKSKKTCQLWYRGNEMWLSTLLEGQGRNSSEF